MPELPEVETIRRDLSKLILHKRISKVEVRVAKIVHPYNFKSRIEGLSFIKIKRRAKLLIFELSNKLLMLVHLKMTGQLIYRGHGGNVQAVGGHPIKQDLQKLPNKFSHIIFSFTDGSHLFFNDVRKFGYLKIVDADGFKEIEKKYGIEPFSVSFTLNNFKKVLARRPNLKIKQLLMDQSLIGGLGNIYSDEACFYAGVRPLRRAGNLKEIEIKKLYCAILKVLKLSISKRGTSADDYVDAYGRQGDFVRFLKMYGRAKEKCKICDTPLKTLRIGGRTSNYCPHCQK